MAGKMKIKKGDTIVVLSGKDKGKQGTVSRSLPKEGKVVVSGVNVKKIHRRRKSKKERSQILEAAYPIDVSNVALVDPDTKTPTRVRVQKGEKGPVRVSTKSNKEI